MSVQRFDPFRELLNIQDRMNRIFGDAGIQPDREGELAVATWTPAVDIYETANDVVIKAELPDIQQENIKLTVEHDRLVLRGERQMDSEIKRENYHRVERSYGTFARTFSLPPTVDPEKIRADYKNGILKISLAKRELAQTKQIAIAVE